jgi:DNA-binding transcriptional regulator GbsR (MarR family)
MRPFSKRFIVIARFPARTCGRGARSHCYPLSRIAGHGALAAAFWLLATLDLASVFSEISVMTEMTKLDERLRPRHLPPAIEQFVLQWGDMGGKWGVNRSVAQIHALLYVWERPLTAEEIAAWLGLARSNVSNSIKELQSWNLVRRVPVRGDRRDHFEAETDPWEIFARIAAGRKEREIDPAIAALRACRAAVAADSKTHPVAQARLHALLDFVDTMDRWYGQMRAVPRAQIAALVRLGARIVNLLSLGKQKK